MNVFRKQLFDTYTAAMSGKSPVIAYFNFQISFSIYFASGQTIGCIWKKTIQDCGF